MILAAAQTYQEVLQPYAPYLLAGAVALLAWRNSGPVVDWLRSAYTTAKIARTKEVRIDSPDECEHLVDDYHALELLEDRADRLGNTKMAEACKTIRDQWLVEGPKVIPPNANEVVA